MAFFERLSDTRYLPTEHTGGAWNIREQHIAPAMGTTPGQYLQGWRVGLAQQALRQGRPLKRIADDVGYGSEAALSRAFKAHTGQSPREWRGQARAGAA